MYPYSDNSGTVYVGFMQLHLPQLLLCRILPRKQTCVPTDQNDLLTSLEISGQGKGAKTQGHILSNRNAFHLIVICWYFLSCRCDFIIACFLPTHLHLSHHTDYFHWSTLCFVLPTDPEWNTAPFFKKKCKKICFTRLIHFWRLCLFFQHNGTLSPFYSWLWAYVLVRERRQRSTWQIHLTLTQRFPPYISIVPFILKD